MARLTSHLKGHVFLFDAPPPPAYESRRGIRLLLIFIFLEGILGPRLWLLRRFDIPPLPSWIRVPLLLVIALVLVRYFARVQLTQIGFKRWRQWSVPEKSYFIQVLILINVIFAFLIAPRVGALLLDPETRSRAPVIVAAYLVWGFYQELIYRGILQTELVRRWGVWPGILVSNVLYTFGPLHFYHFRGASLAMFAAIFAIGLYFAVVFRRSGNLWIVGIFHGIGDCYFSAPATLAQSPS